MSSDFKQIFKDLNQKPIAYYPIYTKLMGDASGGVYFSQLMFQYSNAENDEFEIKDKKLREQTGLSLREYRRAKKTARRFKFMTIGRRGSPPITTYRINFEELKKALVNLNDGVPIDLNDAVINDGVKNDLNDGVKNDLNDGVKNLFSKDLKDRFKRKNKEQPPDGGPSPDPKDEPKPENRDAHQRLVGAIAHVTGRSLKIKNNATLIGRVASEIAGGNPPAVAELIEQRYGEGQTWWYVHYWAGRDKGQPPTPTQIRDTWGSDFWNKWEKKNNGLLAGPQAFEMIRKVVFERSPWCDPAIRLEDSRQLLEQWGVVYLFPLLKTFGKDIYRSDKIEVARKQFCDYYKNWKPQPVQS